MSARRPRRQAWSIETAEPGPPPSEEQIRKIVESLHVLPEERELIGRIYEDYYRRLQPGTVIETMSLESIVAVSLRIARLRGVLSRYNISERAASRSTKEMEKITSMVRLVARSVRDQNSELKFYEKVKRSRLQKEAERQKELQRRGLLLTPDPPKGKYWIN